MTTQNKKTEIRLATEHDIESLSSLASSTFIEAYDDLSAEESNNYVSEFFSYDKFRGHVQSPDTRVLVADVGGLVGYILLERNEAPVSISGQSQVECVRLFVDKSAQGQNWGTRLLDAGLRISTQDGFDTLWLKVWDQNENAIRFYTKNDFIILGEAVYTEGGMDDRVIIMGRSTKVVDTESD